MSASSNTAAPELSLPPPYRLKTVREFKSAFSEAQNMAGSGAGTLVWSRRFHLAEFAVVLEPEQPLKKARLAFYAAMNALADALALPCPPEKPVLFSWPDAILVDGGLVGGGRLAWPDTTPNEAPAWMVFGATIRLSSRSGEEIGLWERGTTLADEGFENASAEVLIESVSRHLLSAFDTFLEKGAEAEISRYIGRLDRRGMVGASINNDGDLEIPQAAGAQPRRLDRALAEPSWLDPETAEPWK